jgi:hypothetical protein
VAVCHRDARRDHPCRPEVGHPRVEHVQPPNRACGAVDPRLVRQDASLPRVQLGNLEGVVPDEESRPPVADDDGFGHHCRDRRRRPRRGPGLDAGPPSARRGRLGREQPDPRRPLHDGGHGGAATQDLLEDRGVRTNPGELIGLAWHARRSVSRDSPVAHRPWSSPPVPPTEFYVVEWPAPVRPFSSWERRFAGARQLAQGVQPGPAGQARRLQPGAGPTPTSPRTPSWFTVRVSP